jgi:hypothetical protein
MADPASSAIAAVDELRIALRYARAGLLPAGLSGSGIHAAFAHSASASFASPRGTRLRALGRADDPYAARHWLAAFAARADDWEVVHIDDDSPEFLASFSSAVPCVAEDFEDEDEAEAAAAAVATAARLARGEARAAAAVRAGAVLLCDE